MTTAAEIIAEHKSNGRALCYAESFGPVMIEHSGGPRDVRAVSLSCTQPLGHDGDHEDHIHCYSTHRFSKQMATKPNPDKHVVAQCVKCNQSWPCSIARLAEALEAEQVHQDPPPQSTKEIRIKLVELIGQLQGAHKTSHIVVLTAKIEALEWVLGIKSPFREATS